jgi:serine-aspartate repeat-containing protein C/D/E
MWRIVIVIVALLAAACSPTTETTTTTEVVDAAAPATTTSVPVEGTTPSSTATSSTSTTTTVAVTTTTAGATTTTTTAPATTTTITAPEGNEPPEIEIVSPAALSAHTAAYDADRKDFGANVALSALASDPNGDAVTVTWSSSTQGSLGTGESIVAFLSTGGSDASQPVITATATDPWGAATAISVQIIVWIPSDT